MKKLFVVCVAVSVIIGFVMPVYAAKDIYNKQILKYTPENEKLAKALKDFDFRFRVPMPKELLDKKNYDPLTHQELHDKISKYVKKNFKPELKKIVSTQDKNLARGRGDVDKTVKNFSKQIEQLLHKVYPDEILDKVIGKYIKKRNSRVKTLKHYKIKVTFSVVVDGVKITRSIVTLVASGGADVSGYIDIAKSTVNIVQSVKRYKDSENKEFKRLDDMYDEFRALVIKAKNDRKAVKKVKKLRKQIVKQSKVYMAKVAKKENSTRQLARNLDKFLTETEKHQDSKTEAQVIQMIVLVKKEGKTTKLHIKCAEKSKELAMISKEIIAADKLRGKKKKKAEAQKEVEKLVAQFRKEISKYNSYAKQIEGEDDDLWDDGLKYAKKALDLAGTFVK